MITSVRNPQVALARRLHRGSVRQRDGLVLLEGPRLVLEAAQAGIVQTVLVADYPKPDVKLAADAAAEAGARVLAAAPHVLEAAADSASRQAIVAIGRRPQVASPDGVPLILVIDGVQDPGNVGTLVRSGAAAGATLVVRTPGSADPFGPKALRAGVGAHFRIPIHDAATPDDLPPLAEGVELYEASANAERAYHGVNWKGPCGLVIGSETRGVSSAWRAACRGTVSVPMLGGVESLNAGAAAAVILFEAARQRAAIPQS